MTAATTKDSPTTPGDPHYRRALVSLREVPTRALGQILIVGASVNLLVSAALRLSANDHRLLFPLSTFFGYSAACRELSERYAGATGRDVWRTHTSTARRILAMSVLYALACAGCELIIAGGDAEPTNIWSSFPATIRWTLMPTIITLSYYLGVSMGAIKLRHPMCSAVARTFIGTAFTIGIPAYSMPLAHFRHMFPIAFPALPPLSSLTTFSVQFIAVTLVLGFITCRQLILRTPPLR